MNREERSINVGLHHHGSLTIIIVGNTVLSHMAGDAP